VLDGGPDLPHQEGEEVGQIFVHCGLITNVMSNE